MKKVLKYLLVFIGVFTDVACHAQEKKDSVSVVIEKTEIKPQITSFEIPKRPSIGKNLN